MEEGDIIGLSAPLSREVRGIVLLSFSAKQGSGQGWAGETLEAPYNHDQ